MSETSLKTQDTLRIERIEETILEHEMRLVRIEKWIEEAVKQQQQNCDDLGGFC